MTKCKHCGNQIIEKIVLCCTCGKFCDYVCMEQYHKDKMPKITIEMDCGNKFKEKDK